MAMLAVSGDDVVLVVEGRNSADGDRLLASVEMAEAGDFAAAIHLGDLVLEAPDQNHPPIEVHQLGLINRQQSTFGDVLFTFQGHRKKPSGAEWRPHLI